MVQMLYPSLCATRLKDFAPLAGVNLWSRQHDEAIREAERAISLNPNYADGHNFLGLILHYSGRSELSPTHFDRAMALNPYFPDVWLHFQAQAAYQLGRYEAAAAISKTADHPQS
jgi:adenylate cyclase